MLLIPGRKIVSQLSGGERFFEEARFWPFPGDITELAV